MTLDNATAPPSPMDSSAAPAARTDVAIEVRDLHKSFRIPTHRIDSLKERFVRPFSSRDYRVLQALNGISFDIERGEFFGIVGRNGSGKSTLLKLLASIYRADAGTIRMAGRLAPFIELGVGFNAELTARENVVLNGVMMGLTPRETKSRLGDILEFAELEDFVDLKLKNYSSGMLVRLAFSTMMEADADILLIDEVLAVGDAAFQQKCADAFRDMKAEGKTIVLVTHEMSTVEEYCHRAMLIDDGKIQRIGDPTEVGREYLRLNLEHARSAGRGAATRSDGARLLDAWLESSAGERVTGVEQGEEIRLRAEVEIAEAESGIGIGFVIANADGLGMFEFGTPITNEDGSDALRAGERVKVSAKLENPLAPGRYFVHCGVHRYQGGEGSVLYVQNALDFIVFGSQRARGVVSLAHEIDATAGGAGA